jgi:hypothetical protein
MSKEGRPAGISWWGLRIAILIWLFKDIPAMGEVMSTSVERGSTPFNPTEEVLTLSDKMPAQTFFPKGEGVKEFATFTFITFDQGKEVAPIMIGVGFFLLFL